MSGQIWEQISTQTYATEADVETRLVLPLLEALGYSTDSIASKAPLRCVSTRGRKPEADYVVFDGSTHDKDHALITVEVKNPEEKLSNAKLQAEFYAAWFKTPFLLLTNGKQLELWVFELSRESRRVLASEVSTLDRSVLEFLLAPASVRHHCASLHLKALSIDDVSFAPYVEALAPRLEEKLAGTTHERTLLDTSSGKRPGCIGELIETSRAGVCVTGAAGYGKSTLCQQLTASALERLQLCLPDARIPVSVHLPDLFASAETLVEYAHKRVAAHVPSVETLGAFTRVVLSPGRLLLLLDAYDRISESELPTVHAWLRAFASDYPDCRTVVFSRPARVVPNWPEIRLGPFTRAQVFELLGAHHDAGGSGADSIAAKLRTNSHWEELILWPYFFGKLLDYQKRHHTLPTTVSGLMSDWLAHVLAPLGISRFATLRGTLAKIAHLSQEGPLDTQQADVADLGADIAALVSVGLLRLQGFSVELAHEIIGDYLRASAVSLSAHDDTMAESLRNLGFDKDGGVLLFVAEKLDSWDLQRSFWSALVVLDLGVYLNNLRTASPGWPRDQSETARHAFLDELRRGYSDVAKRWFPRYAKLRGIVGYVPEDYSEVVHRAVEGGETVELSSREKAQEEVPYQSHYLSSPYLSVSTPRRFGTDRLIRDIRSDLDEGSLEGGTVWRQERVLLAWQKQQDEPSLLELYARLRQHAVDGSLQLTEDIEALLEKGHETVWEWSLPESDLDPGEWTAWRHTALYSDTRLVERITMMYERILRCYEELQATSFPNIASHTWRSAFPIRVHVDLHRHDRENPWGHVSKHVRWEPIEAGRPNEIRVVVRAGTPSFDYERDAYRVKRLLRSFGRGDASPSYETSVLRSESNEMMTDIMAKSVELVRHDLRSILGFPSV